jgi:tRNA(adenine34) deaminase
MEEALHEARRAYEKAEIPVGAVIVDSDDQIIGRGHNLVEHLQDPTAHAEMIAIASAVNRLASWRLDGCTLYVTLEPCVMCSGAIYLSRIATVVYGTRDPRMGADGSAIDVLGANALQSKVKVVSGIYEDACQGLLKQFFTELRKRSIRK